MGRTGNTPGRGGGTVKVEELMTRQVISVGAQESVEVAARTLARYNIGALPVCTADGRLCGMVTDRDLVTRCVATGRPAARTPVRDVMTRQVVSVDWQTEACAASAVMGKEQIRRLPVTKEGKLCGMLSLGDLASRGAPALETAETLGSISQNITG